MKSMCHPLQTFMTRFKCGNGLPVKYKNGDYLPQEYIFFKLQSSNKQLQYEIVKTKNDNRVNNSRTLYNFTNNKIH